MALIESLVLGFVELERVCGVVYINHLAMHRPASEAGTYSAAVEEFEWVS
jgi:hypothetical protein